MCVYIYIYIYIRIMIIHIIISMISRWSPAKEIPCYTITPCIYKLIVIIVIIMTFFVS